ncbi:MAG: cytochrome P450 family 142 subfamily A polypeptide 1, partial [Hyphomicrobiaceae bacterium]
MLADANVMALGSQTWRSGPDRFQKEEEQHPARAGSAFAIKTYFMRENTAFAESPSWDHSIFETFKWLRENDPVHWSETDGLWIITKYEDVVAISKNQELFTSGKGVRPGFGLKIGLIDEPEPHHGQLRKLMNKGFTPRMVVKLEETFQVMVDEVLDQVAKAGECDFVADIAIPLPLNVIAEMIGVRPEDRARFHQWSDAMIRAEGNEDDAEIVTAAGEAFLAYSAYVNEVIEDRRREPRNDLVSILVGADEKGDLQTFERSGDSTKMDISEEVITLHNSEMIM